MAEAAPEPAVKEGEQAEGGTNEAGDKLEGEKGEGEEGEGEKVEGEHVAGEEVDGEHVEGEYAGGEHMEGEYLGEHVQGEGKETVLGEGEELMGEELEGEFQGEEKLEEPAQEEMVEEEQYVEPPPPDPAAPYNLSDSKELLRPKFELRPDQTAEIEQLWAYFQDYTPAYTNIQDYITEKELVYMLKTLLIMTHTPEQLQEIIEFCVRPPHPDGHINFEQFTKMVILRQRDFPIEEELRSALQVFDPEKSGEINRDELKDILLNKGYKMSPKQLDNLMKEVDITGDGSLGVEDFVGTMCIDLNPEDLIMLRNAVYHPDDVPAKSADDDF